MKGGSQLFLNSGWSVKPSSPPRKSSSQYTTSPPHTKAAPASHKARQLLLTHSGGWAPHTTRRSSHTFCPFWPTICHSWAPILNTSKINRRPPGSTPHQKAPMPPKKKSTCDAATDPPNPIEYDPFNLDGHQLRNDFVALPKFTRQILEKLKQ